MPRQSKIKSTKPGTVQAARAAGNAALEEDGRFCARCGKWYNKRKTHFSVVQSPLYAGNKGYLPICFSCMDDLFDKYRREYNSYESATRRLCMMFDIYWSDDVYAIVNKSNTGGSRIREYISRSNLARFHDKTYDDTIRAEDSLIVTGLAKEEDDSDVPKPIPKEIIDFWGTGLTESMYRDLQERYEIWLSKYPEGTEFEPGEELLLRQVCNLELNINRAMANNKSTERLTAQLDNIVGSLKLKPSQKRDDETGYIPFGMQILDAETEDPIPEPDEKYKDTDHVQEYFATWVLGGLCAMTGMENKYREMFGDAYDKLLEKYTVQRPEFEDDGEDEVNAIDFFRSKAHSKAEEADTQGSD